MTRGTCRLTWKSPENDGGERVKSYYIEKKTVDGKAWTKVANLNPLDRVSHAVTRFVTPNRLFQVNPTCAAQSLVVPDLIEGQEYLFRIRAENRFGFGPFVETIERTKARDPIRESDLFFAAGADSIITMHYIKQYLQRGKKDLFSHQFVQVSRLKKILGLLQL